MPVPSGAVGFSSKRLHLQKKSRGHKVTSIKPYTLLSGAGRASLDVSELQDFRDAFARTPPPTPAPERPAESRKKTRGHARGPGALQAALLTPPPQRPPHRSRTPPPAPTPPPSPPPIPTPLSPQARPRARPPTPNAARRSALALATAPTRLATYPQVKPIPLPAAGTVPTTPPHTPLLRTHTHTPSPTAHPPPPPPPTHRPTPHGAALPCQPTQRRRQIASAPPRLRCPCTTPLSDRLLHTAPPTPHALPWDTRRGLIVRPSLSPPPLPPKRVPQPQRVTPAPSPHPVFRAPSGFTSVLFCRVVFSLPLVEVPTLPSP